MPTEDHVRRVVEAYAKGIICSGEVFNQYLDQLSETTVDTYMSLLSPELVKRFKQNLEAPEVERPFATHDDLSRWKRAEALIAAWIGRQDSEEPGFT